MKITRVLDRPVTVKEKIVSDDGKNRGYRTKIVGMERVHVEVNIDLDKLLDESKTQIGSHIYNGSDKATLGYGAIQAKVIKKRRL
jgi:hypothetical protein